VWVDGKLQFAEGELQNAALLGLENRWQLWQNALESHADS
jgi:hypothetical protein